MSESVAIIKRGTVVSVDDVSDGLRIKVRLDQDKDTALDDIPYAFPLLPKILQAVPKLGEGALVITEVSNNRNSQRYYLGPIISQYQYMDRCEYGFGRGNATSLLSSGLMKPLERLSNFKETHGSFPNTEDIALLGRGSQDITMKCNDTTSDEIAIRCGIREDNANYRSDDDVKGKVVFNDVDPAYIQLKYRKGLTNELGQESNSMINIVADKVNIISHKDENHFDITDRKYLIDEKKLDEIMSKLHQLPYGDVLVELLGMMINAIITHVHPYNGMPPVIHDYTQQIADYDLDKILSKNVRIS